MKTVIMAGGRGTRIASVNSEVPKPMIPVSGKPILEHQINCIKGQGFTEFIIIVGHMGGVIKDYFGDGSKFGVNIEYITEDTPLGTAGALYYLKNIILEDFLLINGDIIFDVDVHRFYDFHKENNGVATILTHPNNHPYDSSLIIRDDNGKVINWINKEEERHWYKNCVNAGLHMLSPSVFNLFDKAERLDLDRDILKPMIEKGELYAYNSPEYIKDMGTPDRLKEVEADIEKGLVEQKSLRNKQKAIFLDRDGTINKYVGFLRNIDRFELLDGVAEAIKAINKSGYMAIVVTNQPVIARGDVTWEELKEIHNKMETLLGEEGAYIDDIFVCPHHPDSGFEGERPEYKIKCDCRKPKPGMLLQAAQKYNIDLSRSFMIGDSQSDIEAGNQAGCTGIQLYPFVFGLKNAIDKILK
ncbi:MAG: D-glycero-beta-D-manno-heptose 1,7-bisphosphate 7-phosphatase [Eubacterium sp.]